MIKDIVTDQIFLTMSSIDVDSSDEVFVDLEETLDSSEDGVGLAAPQIGTLKRAFVVKLDGKKYKFANADTVSYEGSHTDIEGCLSLPGRLFWVTRSTKIVVRDDINGEIMLEGLLARIVQHELDHTKGITLVQSGMEVIREY
jgi:peptide deformylase